MAGTFHEFFIKKNDGSYKIHPERKDKLDKELDELDEAEQYALIAIKNAYYPYYNCGDVKVIFLHIGEIWKQGYTIKKDRYSEQ